MFYRPLLRKIGQAGRKAWQGQQFVGQRNAERAVQGFNRARARVAGRANRGAASAARTASRSTGYAGRARAGAEYVASTYDVLQVTAPIVAKRAGTVAYGAGSAAYGAGRKFIMDPGPAWSAARSIGKGAALYGVGDALGDLGSEMEAAGKGGSWIPGLVGFGFKAAGWRAGLRAAPRSMAAMKNPKLQAIGRTSLGMYERFAYQMPRQLVSGALGVSGRAAGSLLTSVPVGLAKLPVNAARGAAQVGGAFLGGIGDTGAYAWGIGRGNRLLRAANEASRGATAAQRSGIMGAARALGAKRAPRGILNRMESVDLMKGGHPWLGLTAIGAAGGAMSVGSKPGYVAGGLNPQNYGGGISYGDNRGYRRVSLGHQNVAQRMVGGGR